MPSIQCAVGEEVSFPQNLTSVYDRRGCVFLSKDCLNLSGRRVYFFHSEACFCSWYIIDANKIISSGWIWCFFSLIMNWVGPFEILSIQYLYLWSSKNVVSEPKLNFWTNKFLAAPSIDYHKTVGLYYLISAVGDTKSW